MRNNGRYKLPMKYRNIERQVENNLQKRASDMSISEYRIEISKAYMNHLKRKRWAKSLLALLFVSLLVFSYVSYFRVVFSGALTIVDLYTLNKLYSSHYDQYELDQSIKTVIGKQGGSYRGTPKDYGTYLMALVNKELNKEEFTQFNVYSSVQSARNVIYSGSSNTEGTSSILFRQFDNLAYMKFDGFELGLTARMMQNYLESRDMPKNVVIDLTQNGGGAVLELKDVLELFLNEGDEIYTETYINKKGLTEDKEVVIAGVGNIIANKDIFIIISEYTGSCAEMFTLSLKHSNANNVTIIGKPSYGKSLIYGVYETGNGGSLHITSGDGTVGGRSTTANPIYPDYIVEIPSVPHQLDPDYKLKLDYHIGFTLDWLKENLIQDIN